MDRLDYRNLSLPLPLVRTSRWPTSGLRAFPGARFGRHRRAPPPTAARAAPVKIPNGILIQTANGGLFAIAN
jgi:hypothetical protein